MSEEPNPADMKTSEIKILAAQTAARLSVLEDVREVMTEVSAHLDELTDEMVVLRRRIEKHPTYEELRAYPTKRELDQLMNVQSKSQRRVRNYLVALLLAVSLALFGITWWTARQYHQAGIERATLNCQSSNDTKMVLANVLDALAAPRDEDEPGEFEERQALREQVDPLITMRDCESEFAFAM